MISLLMVFVKEKQRDSKKKKKKVWKRKHTTIEEAGKVKVWVLKGDPREGAVKR